MAGIDSCRKWVKTKGAWHTLFGVIWGQMMGTTK